MTLLELIVQEPGAHFKSFLPRVISISLGQIHPIVAPVSLSSNWYYLSRISAAYQDAALLFEKDKHYLYTNG